MTKWQCQQIFRDDAMLQNNTCFTNLESEAAILEKPFLLGIVGRWCNVLKIARTQLVAYEQPMQTTRGHLADR
jgi:hypothetical protein